jgi:bacteriocin-like protein
MTKLNNEICELNSDELDQVSGGLSAFAAAVAERSFLHVEVLEHKISPWEANILMEKWEWRQAGKQFRGSLI